MKSFKFLPRACLTTLVVLIIAFPLVAWGQKTSSPVAEGQAKVKKHSVDWIEMRITKLHKDIHITAAQGAAWNAVATVMRDNAQSMRTMLDTWAAKAPKLTALDSLRMQGDMAEEHAKGMQKLIPAFESLYNMMPDSQKKIADEVFARHEGRKYHKGT